MIVSTLEMDNAQADSHKRVDWIPVKKAKTKQECVIGDWKFDESSKIGGGGSGTVMEACKGTRCKYVAKVSHLNNEFEHKTFERDVFFSNMLKSTGICPKLIEAWICNDDGYMISKRWEGDIYSYGISHNMVLPYWMIREVLKVTERLSKRGIVHGDLKWDNYLYDSKSKKVCLTDFGFSFDYKNFEPPHKMGWHGLRYSCQPPPETLKYKYNSWNLYRYFFVTKFLMTNERGETVPLTSIDHGINADEMSRFERLCGPDTKIYDKKRKIVEIDDASDQKTQPKKYEEDEPTQVVNLR